MHSYVSCFLASNHRKTDTNNEDSFFVINAEKMVFLSFTLFYSKLLKYPVPNSMYINRACLFLRERMLIDLRRRASARTQDLQAFLLASTLPGTTIPELVCKNFCISLCQNDS